MKTIITTSAIVCLTVFLTPSTVASDLPERKVRINAERLAALPPAEQVRVLDIQDRHQVLLATDRAALDAGQRSELRSEWKELKSEMKYYNRNGGVIYSFNGPHCQQCTSLLHAPGKPPKRPDSVGIRASGQTCRNVERTPQQVRYMRHYATTCVAPESMPCILPVATWNGYRPTSASATSPLHTTRR